MTDTKPKMTLDDLWVWLEQHRPSTSARAAKALIAALGDACEVPPKISIYTDANTLPARLTMDWNVEGVCVEVEICGNNVEWTAVDIRDPHELGGEENQTPEQAAEGIKPWLKRLFDHHRTLNAETT
jgi:hypothetical protein